MKLSNYIRLSALTFLIAGFTSCNDFLEEKVYTEYDPDGMLQDQSGVDALLTGAYAVYEIGMSHLGIQILYGMFNSYEDTWCERVYSPWTDLDKIMREQNIPLFALESQEPV